MGTYIVKMVPSLEEAKQIWKEKPVGKSTSHIGEIIGDFKGIYRSESPKEIMYVVQCQNCLQYTQKRWCDLKKQTGKCNCSKSIIGQKFGKLTVISYEEKERASNGGLICKCQCDCGNIHYVEKGKLLQKQCQSCGCLTKINIAGQRFGRLVAINDSGLRDNNGNCLWHCKCDCGNEKNISLSSLKNGSTTSCGCLHKEKFYEMLANLDYEAIGEKNSKDYSNQIIKGVKIISKTHRKTHNGWYWNCECPYCGDIFQARPCALKENQSCGCVGASKNNKLIETMLNNTVNISFKRELWFTDLRGIGGYPLRFDFAIYDDNNNLKYLIEYDGQQHFYYSNGLSTWNTQENYEKTHSHDLIKNKYCFDNNIPLIRIPYDAKYTIDDLKLETTRFLLTPENEKEYYESRKQ